MNISGSVHGARYLQTFFIDLKTTVGTYELCSYGGEQLDRQGENMQNRSREATRQWENMQRSSRDSTVTPRRHGEATSTV